MEVVLILLIMVFALLVFFGNKQSHDSEEQHNSINRPIKSLKNNQKIKRDRAISLRVNSPWVNNQERLWDGVGPLIEFDYIDSKGVSSHRKIQLTGLLKSSSGGHYILGHCYTAEEDRVFKTSRVNSLIRNSGGQKVSSKQLINKLKSGLELTLFDSNINQTNTKYEKTKLIPSTKKARSQYVAKAVGVINWRQEGVLSMSGYRVGKTKGVSVGLRQKILNEILLDDDLSDIPDKNYTREWGKPKSRKRYKKVHDSLMTFMKNAEARDKNGKMDLSVALCDWCIDIDYIESEYSAKLG